MSSDYTPMEHSLAGCLLKFLRQNPDEVLSVDDMATKFDVPRAGIHTKLAAALAAGLLRRVDDEEHGPMYGLGQPEEVVHAPLAGAPALSARAATAVLKPGNGTSGRVYINTDAIEIEAGIPVPPKSNSLTNWDKLFQRLQPGQSCCLPERARASINKVVRERQKATRERFEIRRVETGTIRLWRTA